jgi:DNA-binding NarL/FixJ family response regulator
MTRVSGAKVNFTRRVLVVDDEPIIRTLIADRLSTLGFETRVAADAFEAQKVVQRFDPDALVVDLDLGQGPTGIELISALGATRPELGFVLLSNFLPATWEMKAATNMAYLAKGDVLDFQTLIDVLEQVLKNLGKSSAKFLTTDSQPVQKLTRRQTKVLALLSDGLSNEQIATDLSVSKGAIEQTIQRIYVTLDLREGEPGSRRVRAAKLYSKTLGPAR